MAKPKNKILYDKVKKMGGKYLEDGKEKKLKRWFKEKWVDVGNLISPKIFI